MSKPVIHGFGASSFVWSSRAAFALKGVEVDFVALAPPAHKQAEHLARHPMGKVPTLTHGDVRLFEAAALIRYADGLGQSGPTLFPVEPVAAAKVAQWMSVTSAYLYRAVVINWFFAGRREGTEETVAKARITTETVLAAFDAAIGEGCWLVGDTLTAADLVAGPLVFILGRVDGGPELLSKFAGVQRLKGALADLPEFIGCAPLG